MLRLKEGGKSQAGASRGETPVAVREDHNTAPPHGPIVAPQFEPGSRSEPRSQSVSVHKVDSSDRDVRALRGLDALKNLRDEWGAIETPWESPMQSHEWVRAWAEVYGIDRDLEIFVTGRNR